METALLTTAWVTTNENVGISYLIVIVKFGFFQIFDPPLPYFGKKPNFTDFVNWGGPLLSILEVEQYRLKTFNYRK